MALFLKDKRQVLNLPVDSIHPNPNQPRSIFSQAELQELSDSIVQLGILQPLSVRKVGNEWELISGERRLRAAQMAGMTMVPCLVVQTDEETSSLLALVENIQRRNLDVWEEAIALRRLITLHHMSQDEVARRVGKSQSAVANKLRLLKLPPDVIDILRQAQLTERHARALLRLDNGDDQRKAAQYIVRNNLTVAQSEAYISKLCQDTKTKQPPSPILRIKDVLLFFNTLRRSVNLMEAAGLHTQCTKEEVEDGVKVTIHIQKPAE